MAKFDYNKSEVFDNMVLPKIQELLDLVRAHEIPLIVCAGVERSDNKFRDYSTVWGSPASMSEAMIAASAMLTPAFGVILSQVGQHLAVRLVEKMSGGEVDKAEVTEYARLFTAVMRMQLTAMAVTQGDVFALQNFFTGRDNDAEEMIESVFKSMGMDSSTDDEMGAFLKDLLGGVGGA